jgi:hypothetical protein
MDIGHERIKAAQLIEACQNRYDWLGALNFPLRMAISWHHCLTADPIDFNGLKEIFDRATFCQKDFDILFFMFCNDMERVIKELWIDSLTHKH